MYTLNSIKQLLKRDVKVELICSADSRIHIEANNSGIMLHPIKASGYFHPITIAKLAVEYNLTNLIFTCFRSDTPEVLAAMDIFAFPSHSEAFGIALVEAMAMAKPSVCSNTEGVLDIAVDEETSYLFETKNAEDLKKKLVLLIESGEKRSEFGKNARKRVTENFELQSVTDKVVKIYQDEIGKVT